MKKKMGRPPKEFVRSSTLTVRYTEQEIKIRFFSLF